MTDPVNRPVRLAGLAGVMALGLVLAGCSGDGGAGESSSVAPSATSVSSESASPDGSSSASPSASPSGTYEPATETSPAKNVPVPEMPEAAKEPTQEGLEAAVEYWWEADNYLKLTGDSEALERVSTADCKLCNDLIDRWSEIYKLGGWAESGQAEINVQFTTIDDGGSGGTGAMEVSEAPGQIYRPDGELGATGEGTSKIPWTFSAFFNENDRSWKIDDLGAQG
ncbi:DUF6318 family protein [Citricoccus sp. K5]|uniref:DUF6318 family protein n=1 Tax=Citricoccus sp. K5 TaxID=2653135 RepID=UPI0012F30B8F|nr:DUF6318 family protein [Citricoccus sp. K5]VXB31802.1 conserved exported hypothetical protein [Citricoccus sp. K5]